MHNPTRADGDPWPPVPQPGTVAAADLPDDDSYAPCPASRSVHRRYHRPWPPDGKPRRRQSPRPVRTIRIRLPRPVTA